MKNIALYKLLLIGLFFLLGCEKEASTVVENSNSGIAQFTSFESDARSSDDFQAYWYKGEAEISSYKLEQARYGEIHEGHSVLVYVTEDFSKSKQVKLDNAAAA
ncbi:MAG: septum formation inhibitor Maf, partial [Bacteroidota bacterium]